MKRLLSILLPLLVIVAALLAARAIKANKPEPSSRSPQPTVLSVEVQELNKTQFPVVIRSQGTVKATVTNRLVPEVSGSVVHVGDSFVVGGQFEKGDLLAEIDPRDYEIALTQAQANLAQSDAQLQEQEALAESAAAEWKSLGRRGIPSPLTLREPQLAASRASTEAAQAQVERAELDLQRTKLIAPYDGIVSDRTVDPGQFVARGSSIGQIHGVGSVDVRLPLSSRQLTFLEVTGSAEVELSAIIGGNAQSWLGKLIRVEGVDAATQQLNVIAQVRNPYELTGDANRAHPLRVGQFVNARIAGKLLEDVFVVPRGALREEREVLIKTAEDTIERRSVVVAWSDDDNAAISDGLNQGESLITTPLSTVVDGTPVQVLDDRKTDNRRKKGLN